MAPANLDDLFGAGLELGRGVVAKAQLRFRVHPSRHPAARDVVDRAVTAYAERLDEIVGEVAGILCQTDHGARDQPLVLVMKAGERQPFQPGSRGGKWYRDARGHVRYGDPPEGRFMGDAGLQDSPAPHLDHLRPAPFMGATGSDQKLTGFLLEHGGEHGFTEGERRFLGMWYGTDTEGGELLDAFLECAGLTRAELKAGVTGFRFGSQKLTYEEAVFEFFAAQGSLFMGEDPTIPEQVEEWHRVLNDEIKPLLDGSFAKYEKAKSDEAVQRKFADAPERQRRRFAAAARRCEEDTRGVADAVAGDWNPDHQVSVAVAGLRALGLFARRAKAERNARLHGRPHLRDAVVMDGRLLDDGPDNPLLGGELGALSLSPSQLMLLYAAAELHRRWDPYTRSFSPEKQSDIGGGALGAKALGALAEKTTQWRDALGTVRVRLEELVDRLVARLNKLNAREGYPEKHEPGVRR